MGVIFMLEAEVWEQSKVKVDEEVIWFHDNEPEWWKVFELSKPQVTNGIDAEKVKEIAKWSCQFYEIFCSLEMIYSWKKPEWRDCRCWFRWLEQQLGL